MDPELSESTSLSKGTAMTPPPTACFFKVPPLPPKKRTAETRKRRWPTKAAQKMYVPTRGEEVAEESPLELPTGDEVNRVEVIKFEVHRDHTYAKLEEPREEKESSEQRKGRKRRKETSDLVGAERRRSLPRSCKHDSVVYV